MEGNSSTRDTDPVLRSEVGEERSDGIVRFPGSKGARRRGQRVESGESAILNDADETSPGDDLAALLEDFVLWDLSNKGKEKGSADVAFDKLLAIAIDIRAQALEKSQSADTEMWTVGKFGEGELVFEQHGALQRVIFSSEDFLDHLADALYDEVIGASHDQVDKIQLLVEYLQNRRDTSLKQAMIRKEDSEVYPEKEFVADFLSLAETAKVGDLPGGVLSAGSWKRGPLGFLARTLNAEKAAANLGTDYWQTPPLGDEVERLLGGLGELFGYAKALQNWIRLNEALQGDSASRILSQLSKSQVNSYRLLLEWWTGRCQHKELSDASVKFINLASSADAVATISQIQSLGNPLFRDFHGRISADGSQLFDSRTSESAYHAELFRLFLYEFFPGEDTAYRESPELQNEARSIFLARLQKERRIAAAYAASQRVAFTCYGVINRNSSVSSESTKHDRSTTKSWEYDLSATIEPCPWLQIQGGMKGLPYYLWDIAAGQTVVVSDLPDKVEYITISHTWGRWQKKDELGRDIVTPVKGVPWDVPENTKFDVNSLPDAMRQLPFSFLFVWMDLLCIPQRIPLTRLALQEISNQAAIFGGARVAIAWINDVESWKGLESAARWLYLVYLRAAGFFGADIDKLLNSHATTSNMRTGLLSPYHGCLNESEEPPSPIGWFTSLWTLQEACICPNIMFCDKSWRLAALNGIPLTLDNLVGLVQTIYDIQSQHRAKPGAFGNSGPSFLSPQSVKQVPDGPGELMTLFVCTGLADLLNITPTSVLILGNQRHCLHSRAEAIMSVLGATQWFRDHVEQFGSAPPEDNLVLGKYPLAFVNEMLRRFGASFFDSQASTIQIADLYKKVDGADAYDIKIIGSLLPFGDFSSVSSVKRSFGWGHWESYWRDHDSVRTWNVLPDGSVLIDSAAVVASSTAIEVSGEISAAVLITPVTGRRVRQQVNLHAWIRSFPPNICLHAVCVVHCGLSVSAGFILMGIAPDLEPRGIFFKCGEYSENSPITHSTPPSQTVSWRVI